jgi:WD40 repeat protein
MFHYIKVILNEILSDTYLTCNLSLVSDIDVNTNLIEKRRLYLANLLNFLSRDAAQIVASYDFEIEGKSYTFTGHRTDVNSVIPFSSNGETKLVSAPDHGAIKIWSLQTGKCEQMYQLKPSFILGSNIGILNGKIVIDYGNPTHYLKFWDFDDCTAPIHAHSYKISCIISLPGDRLATASYDETIKIWDSKLKCIATLISHTDAVKHLTLLSETKIVSYGDDNTIRIWDLIPSTESDLVRVIYPSLTIDPYPEIPYRDVSIAAIAVLLDENIISISNIDKNKIFKIWNSLTGACLIRYELPSGRVECTAVLPNGSLVFGDGCNLKIIQPHTGKHIKTLTGHNGLVKCLTVLPNDGRIVSGSHDTSIRIWS